MDRVAVGGALEALPSDALLTAVRLPRLTAADTAGGSLVSAIPEPPRATSLPRLKLAEFRASSTMSSTPAESGDAARVRQILRRETELVVLGEA
jgi:hypothetical protein